MRRRDVLTMYLGKDYPQIMDRLDALRDREQDAVRKAAPGAHVRMSRSDVGRRVLLKALGLSSKEPA